MRLSLARTQAWPPECELFHKRGNTRSGRVSWPSYERETTGYDPFEKETLGYEPFEIDALSAKGTRKLLRCKVPAEAAGSRRGLLNVSGRSCESDTHPLFYEREAHPLFCRIGSAEQARPGSESRETREKLLRCKVP